MGLPCKLGGFWGPGTFSVLRIEEPVFPLILDKYTVVDSGSRAPRLPMDSESSAIDRVLFLQQSLVGDAIWADMAQAAEERVCNMAVCLGPAWAQSAGAPQRASGEKRVLMPARSPLAPLSALSDTLALSHRSFPWCTLGTQVNGFPGWPEKGKRVFQGMQSDKVSQRETGEAGLRMDHVTDTRTGK